MKFFEVIKLAVRALLRQKVRTFLTGFAVFIGVFLVIFMVSATTGGEKILLEQFTGNFDLRSIQVAAKGNLQFNFSSAQVEDEEVKPVTAQTVKDIEEIKGVVKVQPIVSFTGKIIEVEGEKNPLKGVFGGGFDLSPNDKYIKEIVAGKVRKLKDDEVLLNVRVAESYKIKPSKMIGKTITVKSDPSSFFTNKQKAPDKVYTFKVVGLIDIGSQQLSFVTSSAQAVKIHAENGGFDSPEEYVEQIGYDQLFVTAENEEIVDEVAKKVRNLGYDATTIEEILEIFATVTSVIKIMFSMFGIIALVVASVGIINTMIMSVYERTKEIGVMKAIGASKADIMKLFLTEAMIIGFFSGLMAMLVCVVVMTLLESLLVNMIFAAQNIEIKEIFITPLWLLIAPVIFSTFIGMLAGIYPAFRASRLDPVEALRYE